MGKPSSAARAALLVLVALIPACSAGTMPGSLTTAVQETVQKAAGPVSAADLATKASNDAIIDSGSPGTTTAAAVPSSITFDSTLHLIVDLGATDAAGWPRYPGASGLLLVLAAGSVSPESGSGSALYDVGVTASTDLTFVDSLSGDNATISQGSQWTYTLQIRWTITDGNNWSVKADLAGSFSNLGWSLHHRSETLTGSLSGSRQISGIYVKVAGVFSVSFTVIAEVTVAWEDSTGSHQGTFHVGALDSISITVDGMTFGTFTRVQILAMFRVRLE